MFAITTVAPTEQIARASATSTPAHVSFAQSCGSTLIERKRMVDLAGGTGNVPTFTPATQGNSAWSPPTC